MSAAHVIAARPRGYHHGDLREALLVAAEGLIERGGIPALTLRAAARAAGVSHAAPAHHFGDLAGLSSELAAVGFRRLAAEFDSAMAAAGTAPAARLRAMGRAYVDFARAYPGLFILMFRSERLDTGHSGLREAMAEAQAGLRGALAGRSVPGDAMGAVARVTALWSLVHGFALLLIDHRLNGLVAALPAGADAASLLDAVLAVTSVTGSEAPEP